MRSTNDAGISAADAEVDVRKMTPSSPSPQYLNQHAGDVLDEAVSLSLHELHKLTLGNLLHLGYPNNQ